MHRNTSPGRLASGSILTLIIVACILPNSGWTEHTVSLRISNTIPSYCQEDSYWCGPAVTQMILQGYPGGVEHTYTQIYVSERIDDHRAEGVWGTGTDPKGLENTLMELGGGAGVNWVTHQNADKYALMYDITYWITNRKFPVAALVDPSATSMYGSFQHWVLIEGFTTDVDPTAPNNSSVELVSLDIIDPMDPDDPSCASYFSGGIRINVLATTWYDRYWAMPGKLEGSAWNGNYVAVIEPPKTNGTMKKAKSLPEKGSVISEKEAIDRAQYWFKHFAFEKKYPILHGTKALDPVLVNSDLKGYYLVPWGRTIEQDNKDPYYARYTTAQVSQGAMLINAYNGAFEEIGVFQRPVEYLDRRRAIEIALTHLCACNNTDATAQLVFNWSTQSQSRYRPLWQVTLGGRTVYVTHQGTVFTKLTPLGPGD